MRRSRLHGSIVGLSVLLAACNGQAAPTSTTTAPSTSMTSGPASAKALVETVKAFEAALWSGDVDTALMFVTDGFTYRYPFETITGAQGLRDAFGTDDGHAPQGQIRVESTGFVEKGDTVSWTSIRYFPDSLGQSVALTATFQDDLMTVITETGSATMAEDAIGCEDSFPYSWHADYEVGAVGESHDPVEAARASFPDAVEGLVFAESSTDVSAPMSGGRGPVVRVSSDGFSVGFAFLTERPDGSLLVDAVEACEGFLEPGFGEEPGGHGDDIEGEGEVFAPELTADPSGAAPTAGTPLPDIAGAAPGDTGDQTLPLGEITTLPDSVRLDFLFEGCGEAGCWRDAHFIDPDDPDLGAGPFTAGTPFHIRHGFINGTDEPLGEGFDVVVYVTEIDDVGEFDGQALGQTLRYTSDYVIQGTSEACGPTYRAQTEPASCEWFVHEFEDGLPVGRHALWVFWEAPCRVWVDYGFTDSCSDPDEIMSLFSSGVDSPFGSFEPEYIERSDRTGPLTDEEAVGDSPAIGADGDGASGSGCAPGSDDLPTGEWFGFLLSREGHSIEFDLACWYSGEIAHEKAAAAADVAYGDYWITNDNSRLRSVPVAEGAIVWTITGDATEGLSSMSFSEWTGDESVYTPCPGTSCAVWLHIADGAVEQIVEQYRP